MKACSWNLLDALPCIYIPVDCKRQLSRSGCTKSNSVPKLIDDNTMFSGVVHDNLNKKLQHVLSFLICFFLLLTLVRPRGANPRGATRACQAQAHRIAAPVTCRDLSCLRQSFSQAL